MSTIFFIACTVDLHKIFRCTDSSQLSPVCRAMRLENIKFRNWSVLDKESFSLHQYIISELDIKYVATKKSGAGLGVEKK